MTALMKSALACVALVMACSSQAAGDPQAGQAKAAMCIGCHGIAGYQNSFPEIHKVPKLGGQSPGYIVAALTAYQKGARKHPTMRGMAGSLSEQDMADLAAYYGAAGAGTVVAQGAPAAPAAVAALLQKGNCASCHGANFSSPIDPAYPKLAGQHPDYLYVALKAYTVQGNPHVGRDNPIMAGMAQPLTLAEMKQLTQYLGTLPGELSTPKQPRWR